VRKGEGRRGAAEERNQLSPSVSNMGMPPSASRPRYRRSLVYPIGGLTPQADRSLGKTLIVLNGGETLPSYSQPFLSLRVEKGRSGPLHGQLSGDREPIAIHVWYCYLAERCGKEGHAHYISACCH